MKHIRMSLSIIVTVLLLVGFSGCQSQADKILLEQAKQREQEDKILLEKVKAREFAKMQLLQRPADYIKSGDWYGIDKGIINDYTRAVAITFTNNSVLDVDEISGTMRYEKSDGSVMASVPFKATGTIRAGQTLKMPVTANEVSGAAKTAKIIVEKVHIVGQ